MDARGEVLVRVKLGILRSVFAAWLLSKWNRRKKFTRLWLRDDLMNWKESRGSACLGCGRQSDCQAGGETAPRQTEGQCIIITCERSRDFGKAPSSSRCPPQDANASFYLRCTVPGTVCNISTTGPDPPCPEGDELRATGLGGQSLRGPQAAHSAEYLYILRT